MRPSDASAPPAPEQLAPEQPAPEQPAYVEPAPARPRDESALPVARPRRGNIVAVAALAGLFALGLCTHQLVATTVHAHVWPAWTAADGRFDDASAAYEATVDRGDSAIARAENLLGMATGDLVRPEDRSALEESIGLARGILADAPAGPTGIVDLGEPATPAPAWERYADLWSLVELIPSRNAAAERFEGAVDRVAGGTKGIAEASDALLSGTEELAAAALDASPSATYRYRLTAEEALASLRHSPSISSGDADRFTALAAAIADLRASHAAEEERRNAYPVRAEIEAFARSIAAGVELEFAWAYEVAGLTSDSWYSGTAEFKPDGVGWSLISLTESIEREWSADENAKAVVVHEVGHAQVLRDECYAIFTAEPFNGDHEMWATAWAIGMGYDLPGSGIEAYGRPSDAQIGVASGCR
jgi:hypothetical protein